MHSVDMRDLYNKMEESSSAEWLDSRGEPITRHTKGLPLEAFATLDGKKVYFYRLEPDGGYTIYEFDDKTANAVAVSSWGQFAKENYADDACKAFARGRITSQLCRDAFRIRKSDNLDSIMVYKRNQARSGNIKDWRAAERKRIVPKDSEKIVPFIVEQAQKWPIDVVKAIRDTFSVMLETGAAKD